MSDGDWDYVCFKINDVADRLLREKSALRRAFGEHMLLVGKAMYEIEWVDSGDKSPPCDEDAIKNVLGPDKEISVLIKDAKEIIERLQEFTCNKYESKKNKDNFYDLSDLLKDIKKNVF